MEDIKAFGNSFLRTYRGAWFEEVRLPNQISEGPHLYT